MDWSHSASKGIMILHNNFKILIGKIVGVNIVILVHKILKLWWLEQAYYS
jgi:hypothetical protein